MDPELVATLALLMATGNAFVAVNRLTVAARQAGLSLASLCELPPLQRIQCLPVGGSIAAGALARVSCADMDLARVLIERAQARGIWVVAQWSTGYPTCLTAYLAEAAPPLLFCEGAPGILAAPMAAVVGTRIPTEAGGQASAASATWMATQRIAVVSGGARGVDSVAHEQALRAGGRTIVVLPQGLLTYTPPAPISVGMAAQQALLLSAFPPNAEWATHAALMRNAIITAFARIVCVIEPHKEGGSIRTARCALGQGKPVLVAPAPNAADTFVHLLSASARPLLAADGSVDPAALLSAWARELSKKPRQAELFSR